MTTLELESNKIISVFMGFEDESKFIGGGNRMRKLSGWKYGCQQYIYDKLDYHKNWNSSIEAYHTLVTKMWNEGINADYFVKDFSDCVERNTPSNAFEILVNQIKSYNLIKK